MARPEDVLKANTQKQNETRQEESKQPDDTMIFSDKNSLDEYIIGKQIG